MKRWPIIIAALIAIGILWSAWPYFAPRERVHIVRVSQGTVQAYVDERAETRLPNVVRITMPYEGRIAAIRIREGDRVTQGQIVAQFVSDDIQIRIDRAEAAAKQLEAAIRENDDVSVESTVLQQAIQYVASMNDTVKAAEARVRSGKAKFEYATKSRDRIDRLKNQGAKSEDDLDLAELSVVQSDVDQQQDRLVHSALTALDQATQLMPDLINQYMNRKSLHHDVLAMELKEARAALAQAQIDNERSQMRSPIDGVVLARSVDNERMLAAGSLLLTIGRPEDLEVEADILSHEVVKIQPGDDVEIYGRSLGDEPAQGRVVRIYPSGFTKISSLGVEQQRVKVIIAFNPSSSDLSSALGVGYRVRVRIITDRADSALRIPRSSLFRAPDGSWQVLAVRENRVRIQPVEIGLANDQWAQVTMGLEEGDRIVRTPESSLTPGTRVGRSGKWEVESGE